MSRPQRNDAVDPRHRNGCLCIQDVQSVCFTCVWHVFFPVLRKLEDSGRGDKMDAVSILDFVDIFCVFRERKNLRIAELFDS